MFVDGAGVGDIGLSEVREREALARDGFVLVNLSLDMHQPPAARRTGDHHPRLYPKPRWRRPAGSARQMIREAVKQWKRQPAERSSAGDEILPVQPHPPAPNGLRYTESKLTTFLPVEQHLL